MFRKPTTSLLGLLLLAGLARAQGGERFRFEAAEALDRDTCREVAKRCMERIERYTRMKYRRPVPVQVQPRAVWEARLKQEGFGGFTARQGAAYYNLVSNRIVVVPWVIGGYDTQGQRPAPKLPRDAWIQRLETTLIHELTHAIHNQNFYVVLGGARAASLKTDGLSEHEIDVSSVEFLSAEGTAELVALRTCSPEARGSTRHPSSELDEPRRYMQRYRPDGKNPFRVILSRTGYQDGITLMHNITLKLGPRGIRGVLYRPPPRAVFFQPDILGEIDLDDPPEPDSILGFLSPRALEGGELFLAVNPGAGRYFLEARSAPGGPRAKGCLIGFATEVGDADDPAGRARYAYYVADPDDPGDWSSAQAKSLKALNPAAVKEYKRPLPLHGGGPGEAALIRVEGEDGSVYLRGEAGGLVVLAHESKPTKTLERRVLLALRALEIKRPTPHLYDAALKKAQAKLKS